jgi:hypothetical protein
VFDKTIDKFSKKFSKKTVEHVKQAVSEDIQENAHDYAIAVVLGVIFIAGIGWLVKSGKGTTDVVTRTVNITYNYYITKG